MSSFGRAVRVLAAVSLLTTAAIGFASSAGAVSTGTVTAITNGVTVTYSSPNTSTDEVLVLIYPSPHTCSSSDNPGSATYLLMSENAGPSYIRLGASPRTLEFGSTVAVNSGSAQGAIAAGTWVVCLMWLDNGSFLALSSASMTAVNPSPSSTASPTTTTPTTTAAGGDTDPAAGDPLVPTFTG